MRHLLSRSLLCLVMAAPLFAQSTPGKRGEAQLEVAVAFADGRTLTVRRAQIVEKTNPGYTPFRYAPTDRIRLFRYTTSLGVTRTDEKTLATKRIRAVEYRKNEDKMCLNLVSLTDGTVVAFERTTPFTLAGPAHVLKRLSEANRRELERVRLSSEFSGYEPEAHALQVTGESGGGRFGFNSGDLFDCPEVSDHPGPWVGITKLEFRWPD